MYRIVWRNTLNGATGHGEFVLSEQEAKDRVEYLNNKYPHMKHWWERWF